jgi:hypothetical protein
LNVELLGMDDLISVNNLLNDFLRFFFVHFPNLLKTVVVGLFESLELLLQLLELFSELLEFTRVLQIFAMKFSQLSVVGLLNFSDNSSIPLLPSFEHLSCLKID